MSTVNQELKYLWSAIFQDGTQIDQPADDRYSKHDDKAEGNPSAFRDVLDKQKESKLVLFGLADAITKDLVIAVNLTNGQFITESITFDAHPQNLDLSDKELQVVFHREVRRDTTMDENWEEKDENHYINRYFVGWQIVGENTVQTIAVG